MPDIKVSRDDASAAFFDATADGRLLIKTCPVCECYAPPRAHGCRRCGARLTWLAASGDASLVTWSATPPGRANPDRSPVIFGWVELDEGPWLETLLVDASSDSVREGLPVRVTFVHQPGDGKHLPAFRPA